MSVFSNIVCCISLSENPDDVAQYVNDITRQNEAKLILVHVAADNEAILRRTGNKSMVEQLIEQSRKANEEAFTKYVHEHFAGLDTTIVLTEGKVEEELLRVIDKYCADLIVIGSMSTKGLFGSLFNKPSESIIGKTRIPVMVIPNDLSLECTPDFEAVALCFQGRGRRRPRPLVTKEPRILSESGALLTRMTREKSGAVDGVIHLDAVKERGGDETLLDDFGAVIQLREPFVVKVNGDVYGQGRETHGPLRVHFFNAFAHGFQRTERHVSGHQRGSDASAEAAERGGNEQNGGVAAAGVFGVTAVVHDDISQHGRASVDGVDVAFLNEADFDFLRHEVFLHEK